MIAPLNIVVTGGIMEYKDFDRVEEFVLDALKNDYEDKFPNEEIFTKHDLSNLDIYKSFSMPGVTVSEYERYFRLVKDFSVFPKIFIMINKDNQMANRVYVSYDENRLGSCFYIRDGKERDVFSLPESKVSAICVQINKYQEAKFRNEALCQKYADALNTKKSMIDPGIADQIKQEVIATAYGACVILYTKSYEKRFKFKPQDKDEEAIFVDVAKCLNDFIKLYKIKAPEE